MTKKSKTIDKWLKAKCMGCGGCCTHSVVPITDADVKRIMKHTGLPADKIVRFIDQSEVEKDDQDESWVHLSYGKRVMVLQRANDRCKFLDDDNRCTVYTARPMTCRTFPLQVYLNDDNTAIENITLNRMIKKTYPLAKENTKSKEQAFKETLQEDRQDEKFFAKIEKWNALPKKGKKDDFLKFLGLA